MRAVVILGLGLGLALGCTATRPEGPEFDLSIEPSRGAAPCGGAELVDGDPTRHRVTVLPGGEFVVVVEMRGDDPRGGDLQGQPRATVSVVDTPPSGTSVSRTFNLVRESNNDQAVWTGRTALAWPAGGRIRLAAQVAGRERLYEVELVPARNLEVALSPKSATGPDGTDVPEPPFPAGSVVTLEAKATCERVDQADAAPNQAAPIPDLPVSFSSLPAIPLLPPSGTTGAEGNLETRLVIPAGGAVVIEARAGDAVGHWIHYAP